MAETRVVCCRGGNYYDVYIGRQDNNEHYGNPASHKPSKLATVRVKTVEEAVQYYIDWLDGLYPNIEPARRRWVLLNLPKLKGMILGCWCEQKDIDRGLCHGVPLAERANNIVE